MKTYRYKMLENEYWWGGTAANAGCPLDKSSSYHENLIDQTPSASNQMMPLFVSSMGRYIWSDAPFKCDIENGEFVLEGEDIILVQAGNTLKEAYTQAQKAHFPCNQRRLPDVFFSTAQYNTWMEFTYYPTQEGVLKFAKDYLAHGFPAGILTIDEGWHGRYGDWEFDRAKFPDPKAMVEELHRLGFHVMLWIVPYVCADGVKFTRSLRPLIGTDPEMAKHVYMRNEKGDVSIIRWWNGFSATLNMENPYDVKYLDDQLQHLMKDYGVDGFKFDGGSVHGYLASNFINGKPNTELTQHELNQSWNRFGARYEFHEYKDTYGMGGQNTIQRLRDKGHRWDGDGINMLIPCALTAGLIGHPFICPDMVGGGEWSYRFLPGFNVDEELFVRMAQCSALFPMMQFSWTPWQALSEENVKLCLEAAKIHQQVAGDILKLKAECELSGEPMLRSLEYVDPHQGFAPITDEFMLGSDILSAPVITKGTTARRVYFPAGKWQDEAGNIYEGRTERMLEAPLDKLLWFRRVK